MKTNKPLYQIRTINQMVSKLIVTYVAKKFRSKGIKDIPSTTQIQIIYYLMENRHSDVFQRDLELELNHSRASVSGVLKTMEKNQLIRREFSHNDQRVKKIIMLQKGRDLYESLEALMKVVEEDVVNDIEENELQIFFNTIDKISMNVSNSMKYLSKDE